MKLLLLVLGLAAGAAGVTSWLLSEPGTSVTVTSPSSPDSWQARVQTLKVRLQEAMREGARTSQYTEERLQRKLDAYRKGSRDSAA